MPLLQPLNLKTTILYDTVEWNTGSRNIEIGLLSDFNTMKNYCESMPSHYIIWINRSEESYDHRSQRGHLKLSAYKSKTKKKFLFNETIIMHTIIDSPHYSDDTDHAYNIVKWTRYKAKYYSKNHLIG